ncbi:hypothetical protein FWK35_00003632 [Aphis craccivora]|uniref:Uncharacterized protein n=1 Tax=Aphis craccivora TaxID=307492 RepID=A0A6G0ZN36_APHCR|nr:hypothetical protein FWK35_00003632 [Aphis craccivora]
MIFLNIYIYIYIEKNVTQYYYLHCLSKLYLDSERSDECIDFTMMCVFFLFLCLSPRFGAVKESESSWYFGGVKSKKCPIVFKSVRKNPKKVTEKREFLRKTIVIQKIITINT